MKRISRQPSGWGFQITRVQYMNVPVSGGWQPAINVYRCQDRLIVCLDLAGVDMGKLRVETEAEFLRIRGRREAPEPDCEQEVLQVLALEIDHGAFERQIHVPFRVTAEGMKIKQHGGFLCLELAITEG